MAWAAIAVSLTIIAVTLLFWIRDDLSFPVAMLVVLFTLLGGLLAGDTALASATSLELAASRLELQVTQLDSDT